MILCQLWGYCACSPTIVVGRSLSLVAKLKCIERNTVSLSPRRFSREVGTVWGKYDGYNYLTHSSQSEFLRRAGRRRNRSQGPTIWAVFYTALCESFYLCLGESGPSNLGFFTFLFFSSFFLLWVGETRGMRGRLLGVASSCFLALMWLCCFY